MTFDGKNHKKKPKGAFFMFIILYIKENRCQKISIELITIKIVLTERKIFTSDLLILIKHNNAKILRIILITVNRTAFLKKSGNKFKYSSFTSSNDFEASDAIVIHSAILDITIMSNIIPILKNE